MVLVVVDQRKSAVVADVHKAVAAAVECVRAIVDEAAEGRFGMLVEGIFGYVFGRSAGLNVLSGSDLIGELEDAVFACVKAFLYAVMRTGIGHPVAISVVRGFELT